MKENFNIDELFKQKFDNFQADVDPSVWANIQAGIGAGATGAAAGGISAAVKIGLISGGIIAASVATWYFGFYEPTTEIAQNTTGQTVVTQPAQDPALMNDELIIVTDTNEIATTEIPVTEDRVDIPQQAAVNQQSGSTVSNNSTPVSGAINPINPIDNTIPQHNNGNNVGSGSTNTQTINNTTVSESGNPETPIKVVEPETADADLEIQETTPLMPKASIDVVPNIFTPDGDQQNDVFFVQSTNVESFFIVIRDRNGKEIFKTTDKDFVWDGTDYSGEKVPSGNYTYMIFAEGKDGGIIKLPGQITVQ